MSSVLESFLKLSIRYHQFWSERKNNPFQLFSHIKRALIRSNSTNNNGPFPFLRLEIFQVVPFSFLKRKGSYIRKLPTGIAVGWFDWKSHASHSQREQQPGGQKSKKYISHSVILIKQKRRENYFMNFKLKNIMLQHTLHSDAIFGNDTIVMEDACSSCPGQMRGFDPSDFLTIVTFPLIYEEQDLSRKWEFFFLWYDQSFVSLFQIINTIYFLKPEHLFLRELKRFQTILFMSVVTKTDCRVEIYPWKSQAWDLNEISHVEKVYKCSTRQNDRRKLLPLSSILSPPNSVWNSIFTNSENPYQYLLIVTECQHKCQILLNYAISLEFFVIFLKLECIWLRFSFVMEKGQMALELTHIIKQTDQFRDIV